MSIGNSLLKYLIEMSEKNRVSILFKGNPDPVTCHVVGRRGDRLLIDCGDSHVAWGFTDNQTEIIPLVYLARVGDLRIS